MVNRIRVTAALRVSEIILGWVKAECGCPKDTDLQSLTNNLLQKEYLREPLVWLR